MEKIVTCENGHQYDANKNSTCPYCPNKGEKTVINADVTLSSSGKTKIIAPEDKIGDMSKTIPVQDHMGDQTYVPQGTRIIGPDSEVVTDRKLVGFLVSYDINPQGKSFHLYEGKNTIGADHQNDIVIPGDDGVSDKHTTILFRNGEFKFKDEFSTNGTYLNDELKDEGKLEDRMVIKVGNTKLHFLAIPDIPD
jgi:hypothetical protein